MVRKIKLTASRQREKGMKNRENQNASRGQNLNMRNARKTEQRQENKKLLMKQFNCISRNGNI